MTRKLIIILPLASGLVLLGILSVGKTGGGAAADSVDSMFPRLPVGDPSAAGMRHQLDRSLGMPETRVRPPALPTLPPPTPNADYHYVPNIVDAGIDATEYSIQDPATLSPAARKRQEQALAAWERRDKEKQRRELAAFELESKRSNLAYEKQQAYYRHLSGEDQRVKKLQWRMLGEKAWRNAPRASEPPIVLQQYERVQFRALPSDPKLPWPDSTPRLKWLADKTDASPGGEFPVSTPIIIRPSSAHDGGRSHDIYKDAIFTVTARCNNSLSTRVHFLARSRKLRPDEGINYVKSVQWRRSVREQWRALPRAADKDYPLAAAMGSRLYFKILPLNPAVGMMRGLTWRFEDYLSVPGKDTGSEFMAHVPIQDAPAGKMTALLLEGEDDLRIPIRLLAPKVKPPTAQETASTSLKLTLQSEMHIFEVRPLELEFTARMRTDVIARSLPVYIEARYADGTHAGEINEPGTRDDYVFVRPEAADRYPFATFKLKLQARRGVVLITAALRDKAGKPLVSSPPVTITMTPTEFDVEYERWQPEPGGFKRKVNVEAILRSRRISWPVSGATFHAKVRIPKETPKGASWLESTKGSTASVGRRDWSTTQHWKVMPNASLDIDNYEVLVESQAAKPKQPGGKR